MLEITGGASATALAFIFPAACYIKLTTKNNAERIAAYACAAFGVIVLCISLFLALGKAWTPEGSAVMCSS